MPLQIRRGTDAERTAMTQPLAAGELIYVTDTQRLFIGNSATIGGIGVTGYSDNNAQDAAAATFTNNSNHTGISFSYNGTTHEISASVDLTAFEGLIEADLKGSVFADDSTLLVDAVSGRIVGPVFANVTGDTVGTHSGSVYSSNGQKLLIDGVAGEVLGPVRGDLIGSVFGDNSSRIIDGTNSAITASSLNAGGNTTIIGNNINGSSSTVGITSNAQIISAFTGITDGSTNVANININVSKGTVAAPVNNSAGDLLTVLNFNGYYNGQINAGSILTGISATATMTNSNPGSFMYFATNNNNSGVNIASFNEAGVFKSPIFQATGYATGSYPSAPLAGMIIYDSTTNDFMGYNGSAWVAFTGP